MVKQEGKSKRKSLWPILQMTLKYNAARAAVSARTNTWELGGYDRQADDKGRKAGEGALAAGSRPTCVKARLGLLDHQRSLFLFYPLPKGMRAT
jgi:hypothetical protein